MSRDLLYHTLGVEGYRLVKIDEATVDGGVLIHIEEEEEEVLCCSACGSTDVIRRGGNPRALRMLPIGSKGVTAIVVLSRVECKDCGLVRQVRIPFADPRRTYTHAFERYAMELSKLMTIKDVAHHLGVAWDVVKEIQTRYLERNYADPSLEKVRRLAIDEIAIAKGHKYLTVVMDLDTGAIVYVGQSRSADALEGLWPRLRAAGARILAVAMDMSAAYHLAVSTHLPHVRIVFDHFHLIKLFNDKLSDLRREVHREAVDCLHKKALKGTRWLLLKNAADLDPTRNEHQRLEEALALNKPLATAYYMKENLRQIWSQPNKAGGERFLNEWIAQAQSSGVRMLQKFAVTLGAYRSGILAWYDHPITTARLEGTNNKIKTLKRQAYGYRDQHYFTLRLFALHESRYALVG